jgi:DNA-binding GntR family transcriptional regulator
MPIKASTLTQQVYDHLKEQVVSGVFPAAEPVFETQLAHELGVSRTPVREALRILESEGFITAAHGGGVRAVAIRTRDIKDAVEARVALEQLTVRQAAERADEAQLAELERIVGATREAINAGLLGDVMLCNERFHRHVAVCSGSRLMEQLIGRVYDYLRSYQVLRKLADRGDIRAVLETTDAEHRRIAELIRARDAVAAARAMTAHLREVEGYYEATLAHDTT